MNRGFRHLPRSREEDRKGSTNKFLAQVGNGKTILACPKRRTFISQGDAADAVFYIQTEKVKLTVISSQGKEEIIAMLEPGAISSSMITPLIATDLAWSTVNPAI